MTTKAKGKRPAVFPVFDAIAVINRPKTDHERLTLVERVVLLAVASYADPDGSNVYASQAKIAARAGVSVRTVSKVLPRLVERGLLICEGRHFADGDGGSWTYRYRIPITDLPRPSGTQVPNGDGGPSGTQVPNGDGGPSGTQVPNGDGDHPAKLGRTIRHAGADNHPETIQKKKSSSSSVDDETAAAYIRWIRDTRPDHYRPIVDPPDWERKVRRGPGFAERAREWAATQREPEPINPATCTHPNIADLGDLVRCVTCGSESTDGTTWDTT